MEQINFENKEITKLNSEEIKNLIPHREPFLFIDKIRIISESKAEGYYKIKERPKLELNSLLLEFLNQTAGVLFAYFKKPEIQNKIGFLTGYRNVSFNIPQDLLENPVDKEFKCVVEIKAKRGNIVIFSGYITLSDEENKIIEVKESTFAIVDKNE